MKKLVVLMASMLCLLGNVYAQRLPETARPSNYKLHLTPDLSAAKYAGDESIDLDVTKPVDSITLNAVEITFQFVEIDQQGQKQVGNVTADEKTETAIIRFAKPLTAGKATLHIQFTGILNDKLRG